MAKKDPQRKALEIIYTFFVGLLVAVFVGVGIAAFYEEPEPPEYPSTLKVYRTPIETESPSTMSAELEAEQIKYDRNFEEYQNKMDVYNRNVSIVALIAAIIVSTISLTFFRNLLIIADGLLLGGVFTLIYSVIRIFGSGDDKIRFLVVSVGLATALVLGYKKFIKSE